MKQRSALRNDGDTPDCSKTEVRRAHTEAQRGWQVSANTGPVSIPVKERNHTQKKNSIRLLTE